mmetsp:Transcript_10490/g.21570  ORF Transcript_10490/g.21570 Transcript_10490/m.21570 type:complete len:773 (-) Transcript_10490:93-2411(-)
MDDDEQPEAAAAAIQEEDDSPDDDEDYEGGEEAEESGKKSEAAPAGKKQRTRESHDEAFWFKLCERYRQVLADNPKKNVSQRAFLRSKEAREVTGETRECRSFSRYWHRYEKGELNPTSTRRRRRSVGYVEIEEKLATFLHLRAEVFVRGDLHGATWAKLKQKCVKWGAKENPRSKGAGQIAGGTGTDASGENPEDDGDDIPDKKEFRASPGWLHKVLKRNEIESKYLQSEMDAKEEGAAMEEWIPTFHQIMVDMNISGSCLYNAAQSSLFFRQLPSTKSQRKENIMHIPTSDRVTLMICTAADGTKVPLCAVGKPKSPFPDNDDDDDDDEEKDNGEENSEKDEGTENKKASSKKNPPIPYTSQPNGWFDKETTLWWIHNVFWPFHTAQHGDVPCVLLMDYCPAHLGLDEVQGDKALPSNLKVINFPINMSRKRHPGEGGTIASVKLGYKLKMASSVLALFDLFGGFEGAQERYYGTDNSNKRELGTGGLACGDPATLMDALVILKQVWASNNKFTTTTLILEGWKKTKLLPSWWEEEINLWIRNGSTPRPRRKEGWSDQDCVQLCHVLQSLASKAEEAGLESSQLENTALSGSYVLLDKETDPFRYDRDEDVWIVASNWIEVEDDPLVRENIVEYECEQVLYTRKRLASLHRQQKLASEQSTVAQVANRYEMVQQGLADAKDYAVFIGMDDRHVRLLDRFGKQLTDMVQKIQRVKVHGNRGRKRKRVKVNAPGEEAEENSKDVALPALAPGAPPVGVAEGSDMDDVPTQEV